MSFIDVKGLSHKFSVKDKDGNKIGENLAISDIDFSADKGQIIAILGRNGSGKSTFARHLNGLLSPNSGTVYIGGISPFENGNLMNVRRRVGMVFQNPDNQIVGNTLAEDIGFGLENLGEESHQIWRKIDEMLELTGLAAYRDRNTSHISGGQKQRLAIASTMAMNPECIVLDEATSMLDPEGADNVMKLVTRLNKENGITIIMVTHKVSEALLADKVYVIDNGHVAAEGIPGDILKKGSTLKEYGIEIPVSVKYREKIPVDICFRYKKIHKKNGNDVSTNEESQKPVVELNNVVYTYTHGDDETKALDNISLCVRQGEIVSVIGQTGSGKSTMLQIINRLLKPDAGEVYLFGKNVSEIKNLKDIRRKIGYVFQFPESQLFESTVIRDVMYGPLNFGMEKEEAYEAALGALELVGVPKKYQDYSPFELSGGLKKRVALAGILAYEPEILILDEPACGLDGESKERLFDIIRHLNREKGRTVIFVSHDMEDVYELTERVLMLDRGKLVYEGGTEQFFDDTALLCKYGIKRPDGAVLSDFSLVQA